jgi:uroporphyrinogen-III decarboxylase
MDTRNPLSSYLLLKLAAGSSRQTPLIFHANGGTGKLERIAKECKADVIGLDWAVDMAEARRIFGAWTAKKLQLPAPRASSSRHSMYS